MLSTTPFKGRIEFSRGFAPRPGISHVLFDFDGTISLIREGWAEVMVAMFMEMLPRRPAVTEGQIRQQMTDDIMRLNGKQTIYQMIQFAERVGEHGGRAREPLWYKNEFLRRLDERIADRINGLHGGALKPDAFLVFGVRPALEDLRRRNLALYLASGTDEPYVRREALLLDVASYFGRHIYGALDDYRQFSKKMVIERLLRENQIPGERLLSFGDGYVEVENTREVGGLAIAVASDEAHNGSGRMDEWKHQRLRGAGADVLIPDFRDVPALLEMIFGK